MNSKHEGDPQKDPLLMDHSYDGIQELDNPLPGWWQTTFYATIIFSFIYFIHYHTGIVPDSDGELQLALDKIKQQQMQSEKPAQGQPEETFSALAQDPEALKIGQTEYTSRCVACHGAKGEGLIGPNLTDKYWLHGKGSFDDILKVIRTGVPEKGMPSWQDLIPPEKLMRIAVYLTTLKGSPASGGKAPEGEPVEN